MVRYDVRESGIRVPSGLPPMKEKREDKREEKREDKREKRKRVPSSGRQSKDKTRMGIAVTKKAAANIRAAAADAGVSIGAIVAVAVWQASKRT